VGDTELKGTKQYGGPRPHIPMSIQREVKIEARFSCIVCSERVSIVLHHIDGDRENNKPENIAVLCPTCHAMAHDGKISAKDLKQCKEKARKENDVLSKVAQELEYLQKSMATSSSKEFIDMKLKYQTALSDYGDKLIFYQCFLYLIPQFYLDQRGKNVRELVRGFLNINIEEENMIISHLKKLAVIDVAGGLVFLKNTNDAKVALDELLRNNKINIDELLRKIS